MTRTSISPDSGLALRMDTTLNSCWHPIESDDDEDDNTLLLVFRDGLDQPIRGMEPRSVRVIHWQQLKRPTNLGQFRYRLKQGRKAISKRERSRWTGTEGLRYRTCTLSSRGQDTKPKGRGSDAISSASRDVAPRRRCFELNARNRENQPWYEASGALGKSAGWLKSRLHRETVPVDRAGGGERLMLSPKR